MDRFVAMAFLHKAGSIVKQTVGKHINSEICGANPSVFQLIRCMSTSKIFIGGLSYATDDPSLREACSRYGTVVEARVITDRDTGRSRGFGFVTFSSGEEASAAIQALDGQDLHGRRVRVNFANDRPPRIGGFGQGGGYYGQGGGSYGQGGGSYGQGGGSFAGGNYGTGGGYGGDYGQGGGGRYPQGDSNVAPGGGKFDDGFGGNFGTGTQSSDVAGDGGGSENFNSSFGNSSGLCDEFGSNEVNNGAAEGFGQDDLTEGNFGDDDDEPDDYVKRS